MKAACKRLSMILLATIDTMCMVSFIAKVRHCKGQCAVQFALAGSLQVLTAGIDGQLHLLPMQWEQGSETSTSNQTCYSDQGGYVSYYDAQWASIDTFVTASTTGQSCIFWCRKLQHTSSASITLANHQGDMMHACAVFSLACSCILFFFGGMHCFLQVADLSW